MKRHQMLVVLAIGLAAVLAGCTTPAKPKTQTTPFTLRAATNQTEVLTTYARWLPSDSIGVGVFDIGGLMDLYLAGYHAPNQDPKLAKKNIDATLKIWKKVSTERLGMDITQAKHVIVGAGPTWVSVILTGVAKQTADQLSKVSGAKAIGKMTLFPIKSTAAIDEEMFKQIKLHGLRLPDGSIVISNKVEGLLNVAKDEKWSLGKNKGLLDRFVGLMPKTAARSNVAVLTDNILIKGLLRMGLGMEQVPDDVSITLEDKKLSVQLQGTPDTLNFIKEKVLQNYDRAMHTKDINADVKSSYIPLTDMMALMIKGQNDAQRLMFTPEVKGSTMTYEIATPQTAVDVLQWAARPALTVAGLGITERIKQQRFRKIVRQGYANQRTIQSAMINHLSGLQKNGPLATCDNKIFPALPATPVPTSGQSIEHTFGAGWKVYGMEGKRKVSWSYEIEQGSDSGSIKLKADFKPGSYQHTQQISFGVSKDASGVCKLQFSPPFTMNEFE